MIPAEKNSNFLSVATGALERVRARGEVLSKAGSDAGGQATKRSKEKGAVSQEKGKRN